MRAPAIAVRDEFINRSLQKVRNTAELPLSMSG
jgi:hypothetical protein